MKKKYIICAVLLLAVVSVLCSCISQTKPGSVNYIANLPGDGSSDQSSDVSESEPEESDEESVEPDKSEAESEPEVSNEPDKSDVLKEPNVSDEPDDLPFQDWPVKILPSFDNPDSYITYDPATSKPVIPLEQKELLAESMFVGDSVCMGFSAFGFASAANSFTSGSIGARNVLDWKIYYAGEDKDYLTVLDLIKPKRLFLSMGMNDLNMTTDKEYYNNYKNLVDVSLEKSDADIYICAITPIRVDFTEPGRIDLFNEQIRTLVNDYRNEGNERVHFVDYTAPLTGERGEMLKRYDSGDGIHLAPEAYVIAIHEIYKQINAEETTDRPITTPDESE